MRTELGSYASTLLCHQSDARGMNRCVSMPVVMFHWVGTALVGQRPGLQSPSLKIQAQQLIVTPILHKPHSTQDRTPRLMVKATFNSQEHSKKLTHLQREE